MEIQQECEIMKKEPKGTELLKTLLKLYAEQNGVRIIYEVEGDEEDEG